MFAARGMAVSFAVFAMVYCVLSLAISFGWRKVCGHARRRSARQAANLLFALRMLPLTAAALITAAFTVPSFLLLEPRAIHEPLGGAPLILGVCGVALVVFGVINASHAVHKASRTISTWTSEAQLVQSCSRVPVLRISPIVPAMAAAGIVRPKVLLSGAAESLLTASELRTALNHEITHVRRQDNLKKLLLRFVAFSGMAGLEAAWLEATEMAADDAAVANSSEALDLAAALIKLSRLGPVEPALDLAAALVHGPSAVVNARVERLIAWSDERRTRRQNFSSWYALAATLAALVLFTATYSQLLLGMHAATEWLVR